MSLLYVSDYFVDTRIDMGGDDNVGKYSLTLIHVCYLAYYHDTPKMKFPPE